MLNYKSTKAFVLTPLNSFNSLTPKNSPPISNIKPNRC